MSTDAARPPSPDDPVELLAVEAGVQRCVAARAAWEAAETDLVRAAAEARAAGVPVELMNDRLAELGIAAEQLPRGLKVALGYTGPDVS